jgi:ferredoxin-nitrate reductase
MAETQAVLWMRMLDRRRGADPPRMVAVDPRTTPVAREADVHLAIRPGTNLALVNGLARELIEHGWVDERYVAEHTLGFDELRGTVEPYTPERVAEICDVGVDQLREAARIIGTAERLLSTVLQGVYQSNQATAAACGVNNLHLLRGMLGRPGAGVLQMNGQPTAQNTRETGADGDLSGMRNWGNIEHIRELAELWNVEVALVPHWAPPTHAIWRYAEQGSIELLWISGTNPAVSLPDLGRIRRILERDGLFVVVQDLFLTETAELADVVLPGATWGEKTGTFTNADRTVHLSEQAVEPPGEARSDLSILLDYARRMEFRDRDGEPLIKWSDPEDAFEAWKACSRGRPCDYADLNYARLRAEGGIQWGGERLYEDGIFNTETSYAETHGDDLLTGATMSADQHRAAQPEGRAFLHALDYHPPPETTSEDHPLALTTGRTVYQFHTRTKTGRAPELDRAAPEAWVELHPEDASALGIADGELVRLESPRGAIEAPARLAPIRRGTAFVPFQYGSWGREGPVPQAANELTVTAWDPVSKQPMFKLAAVRARPAGGG